MDKNMIHIDDLVRQRFSGREEQERAGAWSNMRALLDENMPQKTPFNWYRLTGFLAGVMVVSLLTVGGYHAVQQGYFRADDAEGTNAAKLTGNTPSARPGHLPATAPGTNAAAQAEVSREQEKEMNKAFADNKHNSVASAGIHKPDVPGSRDQNNDNTGNNETGQPAASMKQASNRQPASSGIAAADAALPKTGRTDEPVKEARDNSASASGTVADNNNAVADNDMNRPQDQAATRVTGTAGDTRKDEIEVAVREEEVIKTTTSFDVKQAPVAGNADNLSAKNMGVPAENRNNANDAHVVMRKDTIEKIRIVMRTMVNPLTRAKYIKADTATIERLVFEKPVKIEPLFAQKEPIAASPSPVRNNTAKVIMPSATLPAEAEPGTEYVSLSNYKISGKKSKAWDPQKFEDMFMNTKYNLSQVKFYPGITAGINNSFINGSMFGIHLGLNGNIVFNDRWSMNTAVQFMNKFNNGSTIRDNYVKAKNEFSIYKTNNELYNVYVRDSFDHFYNFSTLSTINVPLSVQYSFKRLFVLAGVDLNYNLRINAEHINNPIELADTVAFALGKPSYNYGQPTINLSDLGPRFGIGYLFGIGYEFTPALNFNLRVTQNFWDNASGTGAEKVSRQLYMKPMAQLSIGYRFGQNRLK